MRGASLKHLSFRLHFINKMKYLYFSLVIVFCISCNSSLNKGDLATVLSKSENIDEYLSSYELRTDSISHPLAMLSFGEYVVIADDNPNHMLSIYNIKTCEVQHIIPKGHGTNELLDIQQLYHRDSLSFYAYDTFQRKLMIIGCHDGEKFAPLSEFSINDYLSFGIDDSLYVGCCVESENRYMVFNEKNKKRERFGDYEIFNLNPSDGKILLLGMIVTNPSLKRFAWMSYYGLAWQIGDYQDKKIVNTEIVERPRRMGEKGQTVFNTNTVLGFVSISSDRETIYALLSNKKIKEVLNDGEKATMGNHIVLLDWDGVIKKCYNTKEDIKHIAYNADINSLILLIDTPHGYILKHYDYTKRDI